MGAGTAGELPVNSVSGFFKRMAKSEASNAATAYFRPARPLPSLVTVLGLGYFAWVVFWPQSIPYQSLGPLGPFTQYLVDHHHTLLHNGHKGITSGQAQLLWFLQTFFFGIASLTILIAYKQKHQK
nr:transmembrane protein 254 isoform X2 [Macaca mulatta]